MNKICTSKPRKFKIDCEKLQQKEIIPDRELHIDKKRQVNNVEKEQIWNSSETHPDFNGDYFRIDFLGNVCIKNIKYSKNNTNKVFACEYEHVISHSHGGQSTIDNVVLLNAGINRATKANECYKLNFYEANGYNKVHGMKFNELLKKLQYDLHGTCEEYNLTFTKKNKKWIISDYYYNGIHKPMFRNKDTEMDYRMAGVAVGVAAVCLTGPKILQHVYNTKNLKEQNRNNSSQDNSSQDNSYNKDLIISIFNVLIFSFGFIIIAISNTKKNKY